MNYWQGKKVRLRGIEPADAHFFFEWNQDSDRARNLDFVWPPVSLAAVQAWAEETSLRKMENDAFHWLIENTERQPVGSLNTHHCNRLTGNFSYGVDIAPEQRGKGYAQEAVQIVLRYYFEELRYQKVTVTVHSYNEPSLRLHEKLGFQMEGRLRRVVYTQGRHWDALHYGMTVEEFKAKHGGNHE